MAQLPAKKRVMLTTDKDQKLNTRDVISISGPIAESFLKMKKEISKTIQIRGDQTLAELHRAIFNAFDREEEHMYEFQIGGEGPMDPQARRFVLPSCMQDDADSSMKCNGTSFDKYLIRGAQAQRLARAVV